MTFGPRARISPSSRDAQLDARDRPADGADPRRAQRIDGQDRRRLGQAVAFDDRQPDAVKNSATSAASGALPEARNRSRPPSASRILRKHETVGEAAPHRGPAAAGLLPRSIALARAMCLRRPAQSEQRASRAARRRLGAFAGCAPGTSRRRAARRSSRSGAPSACRGPMVSNDSAKTIVTPLKQIHVRRPSARTRG